ncbi:MAG: hypothetical protein KKE17_01615 [Proteobacteria bacterium]|nr:hypothetical protein [Pseudomonadota bacterium]
MKIWQIFILTFFVCGVYSAGLAYDEEKVHPQINISAAKQSLLVTKDVLRQIGFEKGLNEELFSANEILTVERWIASGGTAEDVPYIQVLRHFHDPLQPWDNAGLLGELPVDIDGWRRSSLLQAQVKATNETQFPNHASWYWARNYYYEALTSGSESLFALTFKSLGQVMHLLSDTAVPAHVRNDPHLPAFNGDPYENWVKYAASNGDMINFTGIQVDMAVFGNFVQGGPDYVLASVPISALWDQNKYNNPTPDPSVTKDVIPNLKDIGLAEYTNANFFSKDTVFNQDALINSYPHPAYEDTDYFVIDWKHPIRVDAEDGISDNKIYIHGNAGGTSDIRLSSVSYISKECVRVGYYDLGAPVLDEEIHKDYASVLIPRAVGYSTAILDYFFRGDMDIKNARAYLGPGITVTGFEFKVKNLTTLDGQTTEPFGEGSIDVVYQYVPNGQSVPVYHHVANVYSISSEIDPINSDYVPISVGPLTTPIPADASDIKFMVVFKGRLGNEQGGVAAKLQTFGEDSRIAYYHQPGGDGEPSDIFTVLPGAPPTSITQITFPDPLDSPETSVYYFSPVWTRDGSVLAFTKETCTYPDPSDPVCYGSNHKTDIIVIDSASTASYPDNILQSLSFTPDWQDPDQHALNPSFNPDGSKLVAMGSDYMFYYGLIVSDVATGAWEYINSFEYWQDHTVEGSAPAWSPQGDRIAYYLNEKRDEVSGLMVPDRDIYLHMFYPDQTEGDVPLTNDDFMNTQPVWSHDGEWLAFASDRDGGGVMDIWIMDKDGGNMSKLFDCVSSCWQPEFSPDGLSIAYVQGSDIYTIDIYGGVPVQITTSGFRTAAPAWEPFVQ